MAEGGDSIDHSRKSSVASRDKIPDMSSLFLGSEEVEPVLCREHGLEFKHFCKVHMTEMCITCRRMEHKNFKKVLDIEKATEDIFSEIHGEKIIQSVKDLRERPFDFYGGGGGAGRLYWSWIFFSTGTESCLFFLSAVSSWIFFLDDIHVIKMIHTYRLI